MLFWLTNKTIRINSKEKFLFVQIIKDIENLYKNVSGYGMSYDEFQKICRKCCEGEFN